MLITPSTAVFPFNFWSEQVSHKPRDWLAVGPPCQCPGLWSPDRQWMRSMSEDRVLLGEGEHRTHKMRDSFGDSGSPQGDSLMESQPLTHSHLGLKLLLHLGTPNISLLSVCRCRGTYNCLAEVSRRIQSCWAGSGEGWTNPHLHPLTLTNQQIVVTTVTFFIRKPGLTAKAQKEKWLPFSVTCC